MIRLKNECLDKAFSKAKEYYNRVVDKTEAMVPDRLKKGSESLACFAVFLFLLLFGCLNTKMPLIYPPHPTVWLIPLMFVIMLIQISVHIREYKKIIGALLVAAAYSISFILNRTEHGNYTYLLLLGLSTGVCIGVSYKRILRVWCVTIGSILAVTFVSASIGVTENLIYYVGGWRLNLRGSLGVIYPTDCAAWVLVFVMILGVAYKELPDWLMILFAIASAAFSRMYCDSNTSFFCSLLFVLLFLIKILGERFLVNQKIYPVIKKTACWFSLILAPVSALGVFLSAVLYGKGFSFAYRLDELTHRRIYLSWQAMKEYGLRLFGTNFDMVGAGNALVNDREKYNFLDSSYANILIRYGIVIFVLIMVMWLFAGYRAIKLGDKRLLIFMAVISIHSVEEHHFMEAIYNPLVMMALSGFVSQTKKEPDNAVANRMEADGKEKSKVVTWIARNTGIFAGIAGVGIAAVCLPHVLTILRTVTDLSFDTNSKRDICLTFLMIIVLLLSFMVFEYGLITTVDFFVQKRDSGSIKKSAVALAGGICLAMVLLAGCKIKIHLERASQIPRIESEKEMLERIFAVNTYPVYCDVIPAIYRSVFPEIKESFYAGEDLARYHRATVLMDVNNKTNCFFNRGYLFTRLSDNTALYTNDEAVLAELQKYGYHVTGYYSLPHEGSINEENTGVTEELFEGRYLFSVSAELVKAGEETADRIGEIRIEAYEDSNSQGAEPLYLTDFKDGKAQKDIVCGLWSATPEAKVIVDCIEGYEVRLISVNYKLFPEVDTHHHYNDRYQIIRSEYFDLDGNRIAWSDGASAIEYEYDDAGNQNVIRYYGIDDKPLIIGGGYAEIHKVYDDMRRVTAESYYGVDGKPKALGSGQASDERVLDVKGNVVIQKYFGLDGKPVLINNSYAEIHRDFDDEYRCIREEYYGVDGKQISLRDGYAALERGYDEDGNVILTKYYDIDGSPTIVSSGYSEIHRKFDDKGRTIEESYYGEDGRRMMIKAGYAMIRWEYDSMGRIVRESYFGTDEKPVALNTGQASDTREYDQYGNCVVQRYFAGDGRPVLLTNGYAEIHREFNDKRQLIRESYFGTDDRPVTIKSGQAAVSYDYDEYGNRTRDCYQDASGKPVEINNGSAYIQKYFDDRKRLYREEYRDASDVLTMNTSGYCAIEREYDEADRVIREIRVDISGNDVMTPSGYSVIENSYDADGRLAVRKYLDAAGKSSAEKNNMVTEIHYSYDSMGRTIKEECFGADGLPAGNNMDYAVMEITYDDAGSVLSRKYYDTNGNPHAMGQGFAEIRYEYDGAGQNIAEWYYDSEGNPVTCTGGYYGTLREYNAKGLVTEQTYAGLDRKPMSSTSKYAITETDYDDHGRASAVRYYDVDRELKRINTGYAEVHREYDEWGRLVKESYYDENGNAVLNSNRTAAFVREYDNRDLIIHETYFDVAGTVSENSSGISEVRRTYDDTNYMVREEKTNTTDTRQVTDGYAAALYEYDDHGLNSLISYVDKNEAPVALSSGYSKIEYSYDGLRNRIKDMYTDAAGNNVNNTSGYAGIIRKYEGRICVEESFVDTEGKPVNSTAGYCTLRREYDKDRNLIKITYLDSMDKPVINTSLGYAEVSYEYDEIRNRTGEYYYDAYGNPTTSSNGYKLIKTSYDRNREVLGRYRR